MTISSALAIYFILWWVVLFAVLPFGVRSQAEHGDIVPGSDPGAPALPRLGIKVIWTTAIAGLLFAAFYAVYAARLVSIEDLATLFGLLP